MTSTAATASIIDALRAENAALRAQLWEAGGLPFVNFPEQWSHPADRAVAGRELRTILTRHLRADEA